MLTQEQKNFFFELFKNAIYLNEKSTIETIYKKIEDPQILEIRNTLLKKAEENSNENAKLAVKKIAHRNFDELYAEIVQGNGSSSEKFGEELLKDIEEKQKKRQK